MRRLSLVLGLLLAAACGSSSSAPPECSVPADCAGVDDACQHRTCVQGACGVAYTADGTPVPVQVPLDCKSVVCDGHGATRAANDDQDLPDDGNPCTLDGCSAGVPSHTPLDASLPCGVGLVCDGTGQCVGCAVAEDCPGADTTCRRRTCVANVCSLANAPDGTACDDGVPGTVGDACLAGSCLGADLCAGVTCTAMDQCHVAGACDPATGACSQPAKADGAACDDGNPGTVGDACTSGTCAGADLCAGVTCAALDQCHQAGACDPASGICSSPVRPDGAACNDGNPDTVGDACTSGVCVGVDACRGVTCTPLDQCHVAGVCVDHASGACSNPSKANGSPCDDGNPATTGDACSGGLCAGVDRCAGVVCAPLDQCHLAGVCAPATGVCTNPAKADATACSDGDACTQVDLCSGGTCVGGSPVTCAAQDQCHQAGTCAPATGVCTNPEKANGTTCDDGNACTGTDLCQAGACTGTNPLTCTALDQCHLPGSCNPAVGLCSQPTKGDGTPCDDGNPGTVNETCQGGVCTP